MATTARAQGSPFLNQARILEEQIREQLDRDVPAERKVDFDYGGYYSYYLFLFDDGLKSDRTYQQHDWRAWSSLSLDQGAHQFYVRGRLQFRNFNSGDSYDGNDNDWRGVDLDRGWYQFDLRRAMQAYRNERVDYNFNVKVGRAYTNFGTGYGLSLPTDQVLLTGEAAKFELQALMASSVRETPNLDPSHPHEDESDRCFWGGQIRYLGFEKHRPFFYIYCTDDKHGARDIRLNQRWDYDASYIGLGSEGELVKNLRYGTEWIGQWGSTYGDQQVLNKDDICAWAFDAQVEYLSQWRRKPKFSLEYMFASGDGDRPFSPTNSLGGNTRGQDNSFNGFGYRDTGLSFAPWLSNIHIWRAGGGLLPFEDVELLKRLELGTNWFLYWKHQSDGAVSDVTADKQSGYLGWEMDYYVNWRFSSDLAWTNRFGAFFPGQAFSDREARTFWMTGVTWNF